MAVLFVVSCFVVVSIQTSVSGGSNALSFAVGFFLGLVVVVAQQNLIMCA